MSINLSSILRDWAQTNIVCKIRYKGGSLKKKLILKKTVLNYSCTQINLINVNKYGWLFDSRSILILPKNSSGEKRNIWRRVSGLMFNPVAVRLWSSSSQHYRTTYVRLQQLSNKEKGSLYKVLVEVKVHDV